MTDRKAERILNPMRTVNIQITLNVDGDQISGVAKSGSGPPTMFHGWLGLMSAVDSLAGLGDDALASPPVDGGSERTRAQH